MPSPPIATLAVAVFVVISGCSAVGVGPPTGTQQSTLIVDTGTPTDAPTATDVATDVETETETDTDTSTATDSPTSSPTPTSTPSPTPTPTAEADTPTATPEPGEYDAEAAFRHYLREGGIEIEKFLSDGEGTWAMRYDSDAAAERGYDGSIWPEFADEAQTITHAYCDAVMPGERPMDYDSPKGVQVTVYTGGNIMFEVTGSDCAKYAGAVLEDPEVELMGLVLGSAEIDPFIEDRPYEDDVE